MVVFDFDGIFTDNHVLTLQDGTEGVLCWRGDGIGITTLKQTGVKTFVLTTETNPVVKTRCKKLKIPCVQSCSDKLKILKRQAKKYNTPFKKIAYLGNDINDLDCLQAVGLPCCVPDSHPDVLKTCLLITQTPGGCGAVREFCDYLTWCKKQK